MAAHSIDRRGLLAFAATFALAGPAVAVTPLDAAASLVVVIRQRLDVAPGVAKSKWNTKGSIEDLEREKALIDKVAADAPAQGLDPTRATRFLRAQIEASKVIQAGLFSEWTRADHGPFADAPDLKTEIRPILDRITPEFLRLLGPALDTLRRSGPRTLLDAARQDLPMFAPRQDNALFAAAIAVGIAPLVEWARG